MAYAAAQATIGNSEFDRDTTVTARAGEPGVYDAELSAGWTIITAVNGGYLLALVGRALSAALPHPDPFTVSAHYLTSSVPGPAVIRTEVVRVGRTLSTGQASLFQYDESGAEIERIRVVASYGDLASLPDDVRTTALPPVLPPYGDCLGPEAARPRSPAATRSWTGCGCGWTRRRRAGRSAHRRGRARCGPGSSWPTAATRTRSRCCSRWTRCRRPASTWA